MKIEDKIIAIGLELNLTLAEVFEIKVIDNQHYQYKNSIFQVLSITERLDYCIEDKKDYLKMLYEDYPALKGFIKEKEFLHISNDELSENVSVWNINNMIHYVKRW